MRALGSVYQVAAVGEDIKQLSGIRRGIVLQFGFASAPGQRALVSPENAKAPPRPLPPAHVGQHTIQAQTSTELTASKARIAT